MVEALYVLVVVVFGLVYLSLRSRKRLPVSGRILASDTGQKNLLRLRDAKLRLSGQPDYLLEVRTFWVGPKKIVPVELKPKRTGELRPWDRIQLGCYFLLTEATYGRRAARVGYVQYGDRAHRIRFTRRFRKETLRAIERARSTAEHARTQATPGALPGDSKEQARRCANCGFKRTCSFGFTILQGSR